MNANAALRVKEIVDELSSLKLADLADKTATESKLSELDTCLEQVRDFASTVEGLLGNGPRASSRARPRRASGSRGNRKGRRGPGEFPATQFILDQVQRNAKAGMRNTDIVARIKEARPNGHVRPSALVSTILSRLRDKGEVTRRRGKWYPKK